MHVCEFPHLASGRPPGGRECSALGGAGMAGHVCRHPPASEPGLGAGLSVPQHQCVRVLADRPLARTPPLVPECETDGSPNLAPGGSTRRQVGLWMPSSPSRRSTRSRGVICPAAREAMGWRCAHSRRAAVCRRQRVRCDGVFRVAFGVREAAAATRKVTRSARSFVTLASAREPQGRDETDDGLLPWATSGERTRRAPAGTSTPVRQATQSVTCCGWHRRIHQPRSGPHQLVGLASATWCVRPGPGVEPACLRDAYGDETFWAR